MNYRFPTKERNSEDMEVSPTTPPSAYLPSFLLGDSEVSEEARSRIGGRETHNVTSPPGMKAYSPIRAEFNRSTKVRLNGPPTQSLFDETESPTKLNNSVLSPGWVTSLGSRSGGENSFKDEDGLWVVVFGFTPAAASHIFNMFNQCGRVVEHSYPPNGGNWMMIRYEDRAGVRKALGFNTRVVAGNIMLGVTERRRIPELRITEAEKDIVNSSMVTSPLNTSRVRHLGPSKQPLAQIDENIPKKDNSVMSRAMDLLFGW
ncbi:nucleoporin Nup35 isoform X2 [Halyomorpha halys]|uniref:nucleoporin Nup35 isoform X2 n=1 Tax=Halyomorpha halys TaxID=286706 RepID=UPI0006D50902|nr:nucleoporin NUP53 isoform X2 [Halyomorpha halys]